MIFVAIGANLPGANGEPPLQTCQAAVQQLGHLPGLRLAGVSRWYESTPVPPSGQPNYINAVACLLGEVAPEALLAALQAIEAESGRVRGERNAARTLDLDIVAMGALVRAAPDPVLPHPRMHLRGFVLAPMVDLAPDWQHPVLGQTARQLLEALPEPGAFALATGASPA